MSQSFPRLELDDTVVEPVEVVPVDPPTCEDHVLDERVKPLVVVDVLHDGNWLPAEFRVDGDGFEIPAAALREAYVRERDWGASEVAARLAQQLGLESFVRVNVARVLMDFGRFPGSTPRNADHLHRFAINYPFSQLLSFHQKQHLLHTYYDGVSAAMEAQLSQRLVKVAIHTYDPYNRSGTQRPATSIMTRSIGYQTESEMPAGLFDPLYPDVLAEFTADRVLRDRISLTLEKAQIPVAHNYPYLLPEGSLEVRYQVWAFFRALREAFESARPDSVGRPEYDAVWGMLLDTNRRSAESEGLRSYLHMFRRPPTGLEEEYRAVESAYDDVASYCTTQNDFVEKYRFSRHRTSSILIEVRKDLVCELGPDGTPTGLRTDNIDFVGDVLAESLATYFREDYDPFHAHEPHEELERHGPWYARETK